MLRDAIRMQSACKGFVALSLDVERAPACNEGGNQGLSHWMSSESRSASFSLLTKSSERHRFSLASLYLMKEAISMHSACTQREA